MSSLVIKLDYPWMHIMIGDRLDDVEEKDVMVWCAFTHVCRSSLVFIRSNKTALCYLQVIVESYVLPRLNRSTWQSPG